MTGSNWRLTGVRWLKFNAVGGIGIAVQLAALAALKGWLSLNYLLATALAVELAVLHNFFWHEHYTWADRTKPGTGLIRLAKFNLTTGASSILGNLALMKLLVGTAHMQYLHANGITIAACSLINFLVSDRFVFLGLLTPRSDH
jgi:putative flippase GtrA